MQRVNRKHSCDERASPERGRNRPKHQKQQNRGYRMQKNIGEVVSRRRCTIHLTIQHVRKHRQWMPVRCDHVAECPFYPVGRDAPSDIWVSVNIGAVIEIDETMGECLPENNPDETCQP